MSEWVKRRVRAFSERTKNSMAIRSFEDLRVYGDAFEVAMRIFEVSKHWPKEERFSLTSQIRDASRSVSGNIAEAWRKRRYERHFISKLSDADGKAAETRVWLRFSGRCGYLEKNAFKELGQTSVGSVVGWST